LIIEYQKKIIQALLDAGADVNIKDKEGLSAIHYVIDLEIVTALINAGADVNTQTEEGSTLLMLVVKNMDEEEAIYQVVRMLLAAGANTEIEDIYGNTVFAYVSEENEKILELLKEYSQ
jgi:ankyrin repeat protein